MIKLTVLSGPDAGSVFTITRGTVVIGRGGDCDVVLRDSRVSRRHCVIERDQENFIVSDLHTANGLFLNTPKNRIYTHVLRHGDELIFGRSRLRVDLFRRRGEERVVPALAAGVARPSTHPASGAAAPHPTDPSSVPLPTNWQEGMTVCVPRERILAVAEQHLATAARPGDDEGGGVLTQLLATLRRLITSLTTYFVRSPHA